MAQERSDDAFIEELALEWALWDLDDLLVKSKKHLKAASLPELKDILRMFKAAGTTINDIPSFVGRTTRLARNGNFKDLSRELMDAYIAGQLRPKTSSFDMLAFFDTIPSSSFGRSATQRLAKRVKRKPKINQKDADRAKKEAERARKEEVLDAVRLAMEEEKENVQRAADVEKQEAEEKEAIRSRLEIEKKEALDVFGEEEAAAAEEVAELAVKEAEIELVPETTDLPRPVPPVQAVSAALGRQNNLNERVLEQPNQVEVPDPADLNQEKLEELNKRLDDVASGQPVDLTEFAGFDALSVNFVPRTPEAQERKTAISRVQEHPQAANALTIIQTQQALQGSEQVAELRQGVRRRLEIVDQFLGEHKHQMANDALVGGNIFEPSLGSIEMKAAVDEVTLDIDENGLTDDVITRIKNLLNIASHDTRGVIADVLRNQIGSMSFEGITYLPQRVLTGTLLRLVGRLVYSDAFRREQEVDDSIKGFINRGDTLVGRAAGQVDRLLVALRPIIPEPPQILPAVRRVEHVDQQVRLIQPINQPISQQFNQQISQHTRQHARQHASPIIQDEVKLEEDLKEDWENSFVDGITSAAMAAAASSISTAQEEISIMTQIIGETSKDFLPDLHNIPIFDPQAAAAFAGREAQHILPIIRHNPAAQLIPREMLLGMIGAALLTSMLAAGAYSFIGKTKEAPREPPRQPPREGRPAGDSSEFFKGEEIPIPQDEIDTPQGVGELRAQFQQTGTSYLDRLYNTPMQTQNSEWAEFNYVQPDRANGIVQDNAFGKAMQFREPMFLPKYQAPVRPPSRRAILRTADTLRPQIQITQQWQPKFDASRTRYDHMSEVILEDPFERSWDKNILYHPI